MNQTTTQQIIIPASAKKRWNREKELTPPVPVEPIRSSIYRPIVKVKEVEVTEPRFAVGESVLYFGGVARIKQVDTINRNHYYKIIRCGVIFRGCSESQLEAIAPTAGK